ncbi:hypothetical protein V2J09_021721, partial [Rumex salicifolius]
QTPPTYIITCVGPHPKTPKPAILLPAGSRNLWGFSFGFDPNRRGEQNNSTALYMSSRLENFSTNNSRIVPNPPFTLFSANFDRSLSTSLPYSHNTRLNFQTSTLLPDDRDLSRSWLSQEMQLREDAIYKPRCKYKEMRFQTAKLHPGTWIQSNPNFKSFQGLEIKKAKK